MADPLTIGCTLPTSGAAADPSALGALAQTAEALGFDSIWVSDHVVVPERIGSSYPYSADGRFPTAPTQPYLEPLATLSYLAGLTRRARLGTHVLVLPYRHPLLAAKMLSTLDNLSGGRFDFGIGVGWMREEFEALGSPSYERRGAVTDEQLRIMKAVWTQDVTGFEGEFYRFEPLGAHPLPVQKPHPPIWVGGHTRQPFAAPRATATCGCPSARARRRTCPRTRSRTCLPRFVPKRTKSVATRTPSTCASVLALASTPSATDRSTAPSNRSSRISAAISASA